MRSDIARSAPARTAPSVIVAHARRAALRGLAALLLLAPLLAPAPAAAQGRPQNAGRDVVGQDFDAILDRGFVEFAVYADFPPYSWDDGAGPRGIDVEIGRLIADALGVAPRFKLVAADESMDDDLRNWVWKGPIIGGAVANVMLHVPYDPEFAVRNNLVVIQGHYMNERLAIAYRDEVYPDDPPTPVYFRYETVGVENDSLADFYLSGLFNGQIMPNITRYPDTAAAMAALRAGEVTAVMGPLAQLEWGAGEAEDLFVSVEDWPGLSLGQWTVAAAVRHTYRQLGYAVDDAIRAAVEDGRIAAIFAEHGLSWAPPEW